MSVLTMGAHAKCKLFEWLMSASRCYLDYNATAPLRESAKRACLAAFDCVGNASSIHREGREARALIEKARRQVAALVGSETERVVFTSGGTESANLAVAPGLAAGPFSSGARRLLVPATEHVAVLRGHRFAQDRVTILPVRRDGTLDINALADALDADGGSPALLALQAANNETGVLQPVREAADRVHAAGGVVVCDAVQALGRVTFDLRQSGADVVLVSGHKLGGPQGTGAAVLAEGIVLPSALVRGGGQERGLRAGTENVAAIAGLGAAAQEAAVPETGRTLLQLRQRLEAGLASLDESAVIFGADAPRLPNTTCFAVPDRSAETLIMALDLEGIAVSSGSACSSGKVSRSHVLEAMMVPHHLIGGAIRVSFGWASISADVDRFLESFGIVLRRMHKRLMPAAA